MGTGDGVRAGGDGPHPGDGCPHPARTHGLEAPGFLLLLVLGPHQGPGVRLGVSTVILLGGGEGGQRGHGALGTEGGHGCGDGRPGGARALQLCAAGLAGRDTGTGTLALGTLVPGRAAHGDNGTWGPGTLVLGRAARRDW